MGWDDLAKLLHVAIAIVFISGLIRRWIHRSLSAVTRIG
jgi:hypothetical protein